VNSPLFAPNGGLMAKQYAHSFRFAADYLQREGLLDGHAAPRDISAIAAALFNAEPANFAVVNVLRSRLVEVICKRWVELPGGEREIVPDKTDASVMEHLLTIFAHFLGCVKIPEWHAAYIRANPACVGANSVVMGALDAQISEVLDEHQRSVLAAAADYWRAFAVEYAKELGEDNKLPLSDAAWPAQQEKSECPSIAELASGSQVRSRFVGLAGCGDRGSDFKSITELCATVRDGIFLDRKLIPAFEPSTRPLNAYLLDYWKNPHYKQMLRHNKVSENHAWGFLKQFALVLKAIYKSLERRHTYAPYKQGIHGEGRTTHTLFSDPQVLEAFKETQLDFGEKFTKIAKEQDGG